MKIATYATLPWLREAMRRLLQGVVGMAVFDFPGLMWLRLMMLRSFVRIGKGTIIGKGFYLVQPHGLAGGYLRIGADTRLNHRVEIDYSGGVSIGNNVWISQNVLIETHGHLIDPGPKQNWKIEATPLEVADDAWIGANAIILPGVRRIGTGAIVGAGAVVTAEVADGVVVAGSPARVVRDTKDDESSWMKAEEIVRVLEQWRRQGLVLKLRIDSGEDKRGPDIRDAERGG